MDDGDGDFDFVSELHLLEDVLGADFREEVGSLFDHLAVSMQVKFDVPGGFRQQKETFHSALFVCFDTILHLFDFFIPVLLPCVVH